MHLKQIIQCFILVWLSSTEAAEEMALTTRASESTKGANVENTPAKTKSSLDLLVAIRNQRSSENHIQDSAILDNTDNGSIVTDDIETNSTEPGIRLGGWCVTSCSSGLEHVYCDTQKKVCTCEKKYPVRLGPNVGCALPKLLGDQCFYNQTCSYYDTNAICAQVGHNAMCACKPGFHTVGIQKGVKRMFCSEDVVLLHTDLPSLLVVASGIAVLSGLLCFVLKLFSSNRYGERGHYANANIAPPLLFSSDNQWINGIPLTVHGRPSSRSSSQRSTANLTHYRSKGVLVPASRAGAARAAAILLIPCHVQNARTPEAAPTSGGEDDDPESPKGSRRPSISSIHSNASSHLSYSQRRYEQENQQREQRAALKAAREEAARTAAPPTPSPMSTDHLLPSCEELNEEDPLGIVSAAMSAPSASPDANSLKNFQSSFKS